jgi:oxygen-dependent protoporphyrinogen oxidase
MRAEGENSLRIAVVGGGISGVAAAEELGRRGHTAEIFEAGERLGGRIAPTGLRSREIYLGGKNIGHRYGRLRELIARRAEPGYEAFGPESAHVSGGRVRELSFRSPSMRARLGTRLVLHGQARGGLRFLRLAKRVSRDPDSACLGDAGFAELARHSGDPALPRYLGNVMCAGVVRHMTVRMNGAEPDECHIGNLGSNLGLVVDRFEQIPGSGLGDWVRAVEAANVVHRRKPVTGLLASPGAGINGVLTGDGKEHHFDGVLLAIPAHEAARTIGESEPELARLLCTIRYFPVGVVVAEYDRPAFPESFAALTAPAGMALSNAGSYGLRDRHLVRYTFSGRSARARVRPQGFDPEGLLAEAESFLALHTPVGSARRLDFAARSFQPGLCAYRRDHDAFLHEASVQLAGLQGLALAGDYMRGASLEACVRAGQEAVEQLLARDRQEARPDRQEARL